MTATPIDSVHVSLDLGRDYEVVFGPLTQAPQMMRYAGLAPGPCLIVSDSNVAPLYLGDLAQSLSADGWNPRARVIPAGETSKSLDQLRSLYDWALSPRIGAIPDRDTPVIALGGGMVGDIAGFAAATLLRGLPLVQVPTSLLAQVDSSVGGKTAVNHGAGKNLIGAFHQPRLVIADVQTLGTLPDREFASGMAEVIKAGLFEGGPLLELLESQWSAILSRDEGVVAAMIRQAISLKARIVEGDERDLGRRAVLNLGHTFGHAIERATGYGTFTHGEAIAIGLRAALYLSQSLYPSLDWKRADGLVSRLPIPDLPLPDTSVLMDAMRGDKKRSKRGLRFVLLERIGQATVREDVSEDAVERAWAFARGAARRQDPN